MKKFAVLFAFTLVAAGCRGQVTSNPTIFSCLPASDPSYVKIGTATNLGSTDTHPAAQSWCYTVQSTIGPQTSLPSIIAGPFATSGSNSVALTWQAPGSGPIPTGYAIWRAPAAQSTILAPVLVNGQLAEVKPALPVPDNARKAYALLERPVLTGRVR